MMNLYNLPTICSDHDILQQTLQRFCNYCRNRWKRILYFVVECTFHSYKHKRSHLPVPLVLYCWKRGIHHSPTMMNLYNLPTICSDHDILQQTLQRFCNYCRNRWKRILYFVVECTFHLPLLRTSHSTSKRMQSMPNLCTANMNFLHTTNRHNMHRF